MTLIFDLFLLQMWMSVWKALTTATLMLTAQTLLEVSSAHVVLATLEMASYPAMVTKPNNHDLLAHPGLYPDLRLLEYSSEPEHFQHARL